MFKLLRKSLLLVVALLLLLSGCSSSTETGGGNEQGGEEEGGTKLEGVPERFAGGDPVKIMVIRKIGGDDHTAQFLAGAKEEGESFGFTVDTFSANGDTAKFHDYIAQAINDPDVDGVIISHGDDDATYTDVQNLIEAGKKVVAFDSIDRLAELKDVTVTSQDDYALASLILEQIKLDYPDGANLVYLWVDGFPPMVRRNSIYEPFMQENPQFKEVDRFGVAAADTSQQTQNAVNAMLDKYGEGELDVIFATWDAFAIGAARAILEKGRTDVAIYGIDVSNADLQIMQQEDSPWKFTAAVDPKLIGAVNMRILAKKLAGEETPSTYDLEAALISQEELLQADEPINMENLNTVIPGWGESQAFLEPWMETLKEHYGKK